MKFRILVPLAVLVLVLPLVVPASAIGPAKQDLDQWFAVYIADAKAGWMHLTQGTVTEGEEEFTVSSMEMEMSLARLGQPMTIVQSQTSKENSKGQVVEFRSSNSMGMGEQVTTGKLGEDGKLHIDQMGMQQVVDYPEGALGDAAVNDLVKEKGLVPGTVIHAKAFLSDVPSQAVNTTITIGEPVSKDILGRVVEVYPVKHENDVLPITSIIYMNADFDVLQVTVLIPGLGSIKALATEKSIAMADVEPAEVFVQTMVAPDRAIPNPRKLDRAIYRLGKKEGALEKIFEDGNQKVIGEDEGVLTVEIARQPAPKPEEVFTLPVTDEAYAAHLAPTQYVECDDEVVQRLAQEAVGEETNAIAAAKKIEAYVRAKITEKNYNVGFATAAEVARSLEGDCTEHAVLCCALARAAGLPARVSTGLVYLSPKDSGTGVFGYHMWAEVLVAPRTWYPIDAAIGAWDATHIVLSKSDLGDLNPVMDLMMPVLDVMGSLTVEVVEPAAPAAPGDDAGK